MTPSEHAGHALERLATELQAELATLEKICGRVNDCAAISPPRYQDTMATAALLQHYYTGVEAL